MRIRIILTLLLSVCLLSALPAHAQDPQTPTQDEMLEEDFIRSKAENGESHASGAREDLGPVILGNPTQAATAIRVGLYYSFTAAGAFSEFASLNHPFVRISNTAGEVEVIDLSTGQVVSILEPGEVFEVRFSSTTGLYTVTGPDLTVEVAGPVRFMPTTAENQLRVESLLRSFSGNKVPLYRGALEINRRSTTAADRVNLVNIIEVENYVKGVVANESIASFHVEALKAQATAARGYAIANLKPTQTYDVVDSSSSQVYRGVISEHPNAVAATEATRGLVASSNGRIISALYSSSFGGYSDSNHWIFNSPSSQLPGTNVTTYLIGIYDGEGTAPDLTDPAAHQTFWTSLDRSLSYDMCGRVNNRFARWRIDIPAATIKARLQQTPARHVVISGDTTGTVTGVAVTQRMAGSNRVARVRIYMTSGEMEVRGWDNMRNVLGRSVVSTPATCPNSTAIAANFTLTNPSLIESYNNPDGTFGGVWASGGGWGHNTGMSQYGSHGRGLAGQNFLQILKAYYTGVDVGSYPIDIGRSPGSGPPTLRQQFSAPNGLGTLVVRTDNMKKLVVHINETYDIILNEEDLAAGIVSIDISPYLVPGLNVIQYNPVGRNGTATVNVNVH